jgi:hypothetical protein
VPLAVRPIGIGTASPKERYSVAARAQGVALSAVSLSRLIESQGPPVMASAPVVPEDTAPVSMTDLKVSVTASFGMQARPYLEQVGLR